MAPPQPQGRRDPSEDDGFSDDDEGTPLNQEIYGGSQKASTESTRGWDVFRNPPPKIDSGSMANQRCLEMTMQVLKVFAYLFTFIIVLVSGVVAKGTFLLMTSQLREDRVVTYCNKKLGRDMQFVVTLPEIERTAWMWALVMGFAIPELGTLIRSLRICFFKSSAKPRFSTLLFVTLMESLHTFGVALLVFVVLPEIDVVRGAMLTNCVCLVPGILDISTLALNHVECVMDQDKVKSATSGNLPKSPVKCQQRHQEHNYTNLPKEEAVVSKPETTIKNNPPEDNNKNKNLALKGGNNVQLKSDHNLRQTVQPTSTVPAEKHKLEVKSKIIKKDVFNRIRRSEEELQKAAEMVRGGMTFQTASDTFNIPISTIRFYMARRGILPQRRRGRGSTGVRDDDLIHPPFEIIHYRLPDIDKPI